MARTLDQLGTRIACTSVHDATPDHNRDAATAKSVKDAAHRSTRYVARSVLATARRDLTQVDVASFLATQDLTPEDKFLFSEDLGFSTSTSDAVDVAYSSEWDDELLADWRAQIAREDSQYVEDEDGHIVFCPTDDTESVAWAATTAEVFDMADLYDGFSLVTIGAANAKDVRHAGILRAHKEACASIRAEAPEGPDADED